MDIIYYVFAAATAVAAILCSIAIWAPRHARVRFLALAVMTLFLPVVYIQFTGLLSRPKPIGFALFERTVDKAEVLSVSFDEGKAIYVWLRLDGMIEPRFYSLPWRQKMAEDLEDGMLQASKNRSGLIMLNPFSKTDPEERGSTALKIIPPKMPPMKKPYIPPRIYNPRSPEI